MVGEHAVAGRPGGDRNRRAIAGVHRCHHVARFVTDVHAGLRQHRSAHRGLLETRRLVENSHPPVCVITWSK
jgi:hypothetical protein